MDEINKKHKNIKLDYKTSAKQIEFLDTMVYKNQQQKIHTTIFHRPTDQKLYLHSRSNHPKSLIRQYSIQESVMDKNNILN